MSKWDRDLPWTEEKLRKIPPFEFENWAVIALKGRKGQKRCQEEFLGIIGGIGGFGDGTIHSRTAFKRLLPRKGEG